MTTYDVEAMAGELARTDARCAALEEAVQQQGRAVSELRSTDGRLMLLARLDKKLEPVLATLQKREQEYRDAYLRCEKVRDAMEKQTNGKRKAMVLSFVAGFVLALAMVVTAPAPVADRLHALALGQDRWSAGAGMMRRANAASYDAMMAVLEASTKAAAKATTKEKKR